MYPELAIPSAGVTPAPALLQHQAPGIGILTRPPVTCGRSTAPVGVQETQPQHVTGRLPPSPPMAVKGIVPDRLVLILATHAYVSGELKPIGVGANAADRQRHLTRADQDQLAWDRSGDHRIRLL